LVFVSKDSPQQCGVFFFLIKKLFYLCFMQVDYTFGRQTDSKPNGQDIITIKASGFEDKSMNALRELFIKFCKDQGIKINFSDENHPNG
jgi:hypothetical protein